MRYWQATLKSGELVQETANVEQSRALWAKIQSEVVSLRLYCEDFTIELPNNQLSYSQGKGGSASLNGGDFQIESHWISCILSNAQVLKLRVHRNNKVTTEIS